MWKRGNQGHTKRLKENNNKRVSETGLIRSHDKKTKTDCVLAEVDQPHSECPFHARDARQSTKVSMLSL